MNDKFTQIEQAAHSGAFGCNPSPLPSDAQKVAGNYRKGRVAWRGLVLVIEQPRNSYRCGTDPGGKQWQSLMRAHYGSILGVRGNDGDLMDIFVGAWPESETVWVVNQNGKGGAFDEHKCLICFESEEAARNAYMHSYERGWKGLGSMVKCTVEQFKWWLKFGDHKRPMKAEDLPFDGSEEMDERMVAWDSAALPVGTDLAGVLYDLRRDDKDGLMLDGVTVADILEDADGEMALDALVVPVAKLERKMQQLQAIMGASGESVSIAAMQITPPFKQRGTTNVAVVFELSDGQTVTIFLHNPDTTPNKLAPTDEMISWKWLLNKKDVTIVVAPEKGNDLNPREVGRRIMKLAEKNSARFAQANKNRAERLASIESLKAGVEAKEAELESLTKEIEVLTVKVEEKKAESALDFTASDVANFGAAELARRAAWFQKYGHEKYVGNPAFVALKSALMNEFGTDEIQAFAGGTVNGVAPVDASIAYAQSKKASSSGLPSGWTEASPGGMATNKDEETGGIVDKEIVSGKWFAVANKEGVGTLEGFDTRAEAFAALAAAVASSEQAVPPTLNPSSIGDVRQFIRRNASQSSVVAEDDRFFYRVTVAEGYAVAYTVGKMNSSAGEATPLTWAASEFANYVADVAKKEAADRNEFLAKQAKELGLGGAVAKPAELDPTSPEGYAKVMADPELQVAYQDVLDSFFGRRIVDVRNALRSLGWEGERDGDLGKGMNWIDVKPKFVGAGANVVGMTMNIMGTTDGKSANVVASFADDLTKTPAELAAEIDASVQPVAPGAALYAELRPLLVSRGWADEDATEERMTKGDYFIFSRNSMLNDVYVNKWGKESGYTYIAKIDPKGKTAAELADAIEQAVNADQGGGADGGEEPASPTADELEAAARSGAEVKRVARNLADPSTKGAVPVAYLTDGKEINIALWTEEDFKRAAAAVEEGEYQSAYTPFDPSQVKMPTAVQLGAKTRVANGATTMLRSLEGSDGWTNGIILDVSRFPAFLKKVADEVFGEGQISSVPQTSWERIIDRAKSQNGIKVEPISAYDAEFSDTSSTEAIRKGKKVPVNAFVLANADRTVVTQIDKRYYGYFAKTYKGADFFISDEKSPILVKHNGKIVGVAMPANTPNAQNTLKRAMKAQPKAAKTEQAPAEQYPEDVVSVYAAKGGATKMIIYKNEGYPGLYSKRGDYGMGGLDTPAQMAKQVGYFKTDFPSAKLVYGTPVEELPGPEAVAAQKRNQSPLDEFENGGGEPWKITRATWVSLMRGHMAFLGQSGDDNDFKSFHEGAVKQALDEGKPVPAGVLADYPGMKAETAAEKEARYAKAEQNLNRVISAAAGEDAGKEEAKSFLQSVIDGTADMMALDLADRLTVIHEKYASDSEMLAKFNEAAKAYSSWMIDAAKRAMS